MTTRSRTRRSIALRATASGRGGRALLLVAALAGCAASCGGEKLGSGGSGGSTGTGGSPGTGGADGGGLECTLIGCEDQFSARVTVDASMVPAGTHTIDVTADGKETTCTFPSPTQAAVNGGIPVACRSVLPMCQSASSPSRTAPLRATRAIRHLCHDCRREISPKRSPIAGTPATVHVRQLLDGTVLLDQTVSATYVTDSNRTGPAAGPQSRHRQSRPGPSPDHPTRTAPGRRGCIRLADAQPPVLASSCSRGPAVPK